MAAEALAVGAFGHIALEMRNPVVVRIIGVRCPFRFSVSYSLIPPIVVGIGILLPETQLVLLANCL
jgi:hypothetical protein